jgi:ABC-type sugar transport system ATPase subunit
VVSAGSSHDLNGDEVTVLIRPEQLVVRFDPAPDMVSSRIAAVEYHGHETLLELDVASDSGDLTLTARIRPQPGLIPGAEVFVRVAGQVHTWPATAATSG